MCYVTHNITNETRQIGRNVGKKEEEFSSRGRHHDLKATKGKKNNNNNNLLEQVVVIAIDVLRVEQSLQSLSNGFYRTGFIYLQLPLYQFFFLIRAITKRVSCKIVYLLRLFDEMFDF
ncbi:hypothetical protein GHT06_013040 [Daphnia sinensis]|uniref:Uncharacterized protein n=1 Tax=Daphnia sinensis TaxID=1820382 RepID=A0AAD5KYP6_9CRUS|nr:hypothetical protein GHT06_013040 [Daphnia sinensis]